MKRRLLASLDVLEEAVRIGYPKRRQLIVEVARYLIAYWRAAADFMVSDEPVLIIPQELVELCRTLLASPNEFVLSNQQFTEAALYCRVGLLLARWGAWEILVEKDREKAEKGNFADAQISMARTSLSFTEDENPCTKGTHIVSRKSYPDTLVYDQNNDAHIIEKKDPNAELPDISTLVVSKPSAENNVNELTKSEEKSPTAASPRNVPSSPRASSAEYSADVRAFEASPTWQAALKCFQEGWWQNIPGFEPSDLPRVPTTLPAAQDDDINYHGEQDMYAVGTVNRILLFCDATLRVAGDLNEFDLQLMIRHATCLLTWANWQHEGLHDVSDNEAHLEVYTIYRRAAILVWNGLHAALKLMEPLRRSTSRETDPQKKTSAVRPEEYKSEINANDMKEGMRVWANAVDGMVSIRRQCRAVDFRDPAERKLASIAFHFIHAFRSLVQKDFDLSVEISLRPIISLSLAGDDDVARLAWQLLHEISVSGKGEMKLQAERNVTFMADLQKTSVTDQQEWCRAKLNELPSDIKRILAKSEVPTEELITHWDLLRNILYFDVGFRLPIPFQKPIDKNAKSARRRRATEARVLARKHERASVAMHEHMFKSMLIPRDPRGDYSKWELIGHGGFGEVFSAIRRGKEIPAGTKPEPDVAIKCIRCHNESDNLLVQREILALGMCRHANLIKLVSAYTHDSCLWVVMEFCNGGSLREFLLSNNMKEPEIAYIATEILKGLEYLAEHDKIHRDLKPDNVLLHISGAVTIADLGLLVDYAREKLKTSMAGTPSYIAPEMIRNESYDSKLDIWSFGCVCLEMANAVPPRQKEHIVKCLLGTATQPPPKLKQESKWSPEFKSFLEGCLNRDPAKRQSATQLLKHPFLQKACDKEAIKAQFRHVFTARALKAAGLC